MVNQNEVKKALEILFNEATAISDYDDYSEVMEKLEELKEIFQMN